MDLTREKRIQMNTSGESAFLEEKWVKARLRLGYLKGLYPTQFHFPAGISRQPTTGLYRPSFKALEEQYRLVVVRKELSSREHVRTGKEMRMCDMFYFYSRKKVLQSVWIGPNCFDLFLPNIRSEGSTGRIMRGLAIEVDGDVHHYEGKMKKDELKNQILQMIGIGMTSIPNWDFNAPTVKALLKNISQSKKLDTRERRRLWRRIYLLTLAFELTDKQFLSLFSMEVPT